MPPFDFPTLGLLLVVASLVAVLTRRLGVPYAVGLVLAGIVLVLTRVRLALPLTPDLIYRVLLPPLVFEAAIQIAWRPFRRELPLLLALVTLGVALGAVVVGAGMHWLAGWSALGAAFFGVLIAATDPVSVIALFKTVRVPERLHLLVEAESLLNDGVAAVAFAALLAIAAPGHPPIGPGTIALRFAGGAAGGVAMGAAVALPLVLFAGRVADPLVEITLTTLAAWGSFLAAEHCGVSGVLAALTAGLIIGNYGFAGRFSAAGRAALLGFWDYAAFLANSVVFILIGTQAATRSFMPVLGAATLATALALAGRAATVYPVALLFARSRLALPWASQHVLVWGGLRGALALALALALPATLPERGDLITAAFAVIAFSIVVQGLTMPALIRRLGLLER